MDPSKIENIGQSVTLKSGETDTYRESQPGSVYLEQKLLEPSSGRNTYMITTNCWMLTVDYLDSEKLLGECSLRSPQHIPWVHSQETQQIVTVKTPK